MGLSSANAICPLLGFWLDLEYMPWWKAGVLFALLAAIVLVLGLRSMAGLRPVRKWVSIVLRLCVIAVLVMMLGGARWRREHHLVELLVLRDTSESAERLYQSYPGKNLDDSVDDFLKAATGNPHKHHRDDCAGMFSFSDQVHLEALSNTALDLTSHPNREYGQSTDIGSAIQMAMANFRRDAMRRILLISDGLNNFGDWETAVAAAVAQQVPIDVMKLSFSVQDEVMVERIAAPSWRREADKFDIFISLSSTNRKPVSGTLRVYEGPKELVAEPVTLPPARLNDDGRLEPSKYVHRVSVPPLNERGVRRFRARFEPDEWNQRGTASAGPLGGDTLRENNEKTAFTFVQGQGKILYVDNAPNEAGLPLMNALTREGMKIDRLAPAAVPEDLARLQTYDVVILNNVPRGRGGLSERQGTLLARYVHDFGGGLVMLGGPQSMGAGSWQGSKLEEVMPVSFDVPPERQMPKGALVLIVHSCEMDNGAYWGPQCALKAVEALSARDDIGIITYGMRGGGSDWDYELGPKGDGVKVIDAIKRMQPMDMTSFDDSIGVALNGKKQGGPCLKTSDAASKHIIIISDGDPTEPPPGMYDELKAANVSISTVTVSPHGALTDTMKRLALATGGNYYGPIDNNFSQLPQIFIKEAAVVRRTLIQERSNPPIDVVIGQDSDVMKSIPKPPPVTGLVLCTKKDAATMPLVAQVDGHDDPLLVHWQAGLGKTAVFTSDAGSLWDAGWIGQEFGGQYAKLFAQLVDSVSRPQMSDDFIVDTERRGDKAVVTVVAAGKSAGFTNDLKIVGTVVDPDAGQRKIQLVQTGPGTYVGEFTTPREGDYVVALQYEDERKRTGWLASGVSVDESPEMRKLQSDDALLDEIARRTRGRVIKAFDPATADVFSRQNLPRSSSPMPVWDTLAKILLLLVLLDVACRRLAWDWQTMKRLAAATAQRIRSYTTTRQVKTEQSLEALRKAKEEAESKTKQADKPAPVKPPPLPKTADVKFEAKGSAEDITGAAQSAASATATGKPAPSRPTRQREAGASGDGTMSSLLKAKRRAQEQMKPKEDE